MRHLSTIVVMLSLVVLPVQAQSSQPTEIARYGQGERNEFMSWSPDGARLAVGGNHGYWLYDTQDPKHLAEFVLTDTYTRLAYNPDGRLLGVSGDTVQVMDAGGELLWETEGDIAAWSRDGSLIAVGNGPVMLMSIWDAGTQTLLDEHAMEASEEGRGKVLQFLFGADNQQVYFRYFVSDPYPAYWAVSYVWEPETNTVIPLDDYFPDLNDTCEYTSPCHSPVAISPDGMTLALLRIGGNNYYDEVTFLQPSTGEQHVIQLEQSPTARASFSPDGTLFAVAENPRGISVWDTTTWQQHHLILDTGVPLFSPDSRYIATDNRVTDAQTGEFAWEITPAVRYLPSPDGRFIMELGMPPRILDTVTGAEIAALQGIDSPVVEGAISSDGRWVATDHENLTAYLWDVSTRASTEILQITEEVRGELRMEPRSGPTFPARWSLAFSPDSSLLAVGNNGAEVMDRAFVQDIQTGTRYNLPENTRFDAPVFAANNLVVLLDNGFERVAWEPRTNTLPPQSIFELVPRFAIVSDDGRLLALVESNQTRIEVYEVATEALLAEITLPEEPLGVALLGFSANNTYLAYNVYYGETDPGMDYIWDVARNEFVAPEVVTDIWFQWRSPSYGAVTESTSEQSALMLYPSDATPDTLPIGRLGRGGARALFFPDESHVLSVYFDGVIVVWQLD